MMCWEMQEWRDMQKEKLKEELKEELKKKAILPAR